MKIISFCIAIIVAVGGAFSQNKLRVYMDTKQYYEPSVGNYLEVQFEFVGPSLKYKGVDNGLQGEVAIQMAVVSEKNDTVQRSAYRLVSPFMKDSIVENFYEVRRFALNPGNYTISVKLLDMQAEDDGLSATVPITMSDRSSDPILSSVQIIEVASKGNPQSPFFKSGLDILPRLSNYYPQELSFLPYYVEAYNSLDMSDSVFGIRHRIIDMETQEELPLFTEFFRYKRSEIVPVIKNIDITNLLTGKYALEISIIDKKMMVLANADYIFERTNEPVVQFDPENVILDPNFTASITKDSALFFLGSLIPIAKAETQRIILRTLADKNADKALSTIQAFWLSTSGTQAYNEWMKYKAQVLMVQKLYATSFQDGFETDRGRVYLQYGPPTNVVAKEASASEYPYEIWQYNKIQRFSNKRFIFYNPDLLPNSYRLLHSDMIGELKNNNWPLALNQRNSSNGNVDDPNGDVQQHYGGQSNTLFRQY